MSQLEIRVPRLNPNDDEVLLVEWLAPDGARVTAQQAVCIVESTKSAVELESPGEGILRQRAKAGLRVPVDALIGVIGGEIGRLGPAREVAAGTPAMQFLGVFSKAARRRLAELGLTEADFQEYETIDVETVEAVAAGKARANPLPVIEVDDSCLVIYGTRNAALIAYDCFQSSGRHRPVAFLDYSPTGIEHMGLPVIHRAHARELCVAGIRRAFVAMPSPRETLEAAAYLETCGFELANAVHSSAFVSSSAVLAGNVLVGAQSYIGPSAQLGRGSRVLACASVAHHSKLGAGSIVADGTVLGGNVILGDEAVLGIGCSVNAKVRVGAHARLASGCSLHQDVPDYAVVRPAQHLIVKVLSESEGNMKSEDVKNIE